MIASKTWKALILAMPIALGLMAASLFGQSNEGGKPVMAEDVFKNVQVLKGISVNEFMQTMGFFSAALGYNCTNCHVEESLQSWAKFADDIPAKRRARSMILMVNGFNKNNFGGKRALTCYTCHRGSGIPKVTPSLVEQYGSPVDDPNEVEMFVQNPNAPTVDQVFDRYLKAVGGSQRLEDFASFYANGTYAGFDTSDLKVPMEILAKAPNQRTVIVHGPLGDGTTTFDGRMGWISGPDKPVPVLALSAGADLDGMNLDASLAFPLGVRKALGRWRTGFPITAIDDRRVDVAEGIAPSGLRVKFFFDQETGLLLRVTQFTNTAVGIVPAQVDYSDYRDVAGVKMPFKWTTTWTDGQSTTELTEIRANVSIDAAKFARPSAPAAQRSRTAEKRSIP